jgi:predicted  nucleic acid-binding Zn-ribbon protein
MDLSTEIQILQNNIRDLQSQLASAHIRIAELLNDKSASNEEVIKEKQFIQEITGKLSKVNLETQEKIQTKMNSIPDVLDSKQLLKE